MPFIALKVARAGRPCVRPQTTITVPAANGPQVLTRGQVQATNMAQQVFRSVTGTRAGRT